MIGSRIKLYGRSSRTLTTQKIFNVALTYFSFYLSKIVRKPILWHLPFTMSFEPTTSCNLSCPECPSGLKTFSRPTGNAALDLYKQWVLEIKSHLVFLYLYFQGEPYLHKDFFKMVQWAKQNNLLVITSTNGHFMTSSKAIETVQSGLDRLIISVDGTTQATYEAYRKDGKLENVIEGIKLLVATKKALKTSHPFISLQMLVVAPNEHEIEAVYKLGKDLGVDEVLLKTAQIYDFKHGHSLIPINEKYSRYKKISDKQWEIKNKLENQCWKMWHSAVVTWDGKMIPCCFDKDATYTMGNVFTTPMATIWKQQLYNSFRKQLLLSRKNIDICTNCSEGTKVWETI